MVKKMSKKEMMILAGSIVASMAAGIIVGCLKEKFMSENECTCIIDEL